MKKTHFILIQAAICVAGIVMAGNLQASGHSALTKQARAAHIDATEMVQWQRLEYAQKHAAEQGKTVLIFVEADWCGICRRMLRDVFPDQEVQLRIDNSYVPVMINVESRKQVLYNGETYTHREFARSMGVGAVPTLLFVSADGEVMAHKTGFVSVDQMTVLLDFIVSDKFGTLSFDEFLSEGGGG